MSKLVDEFSNYINDIFTNQPVETIPEKLKHVLERFQDATVREVSATMLTIDVECSDWPDGILSEKMLRHVKFRSRADQMLPAHCMMLEAAKRLRKE